MAGERRKTYVIPFDKGEMAGTQDYNSIPVGGIRSQNVDYREDGSLIPRPALTVHSEPAKGDVYAMFGTSDGELFIIALGKIWWRESDLSSWVEVTWLGAGGGAAPTLTDSVRYDWVEFDNTKVIFTPRSSAHACFIITKTKSGGTAWEYDELFVTDNTKTAGQCIVLDENRLIIGRVDHANRLRYSTAGTCTAGYDTNYVDVADRGENVRRLMPASNGFYVIKDFSIWRKSRQYADGIHSYQFSHVMDIFGGEDCRSVSLGYGSFAILTLDGVFIISDQGPVNITDKKLWSEMSTYTRLDPILHYLPKEKQILITIISDDKLTWAYSLKDGNWRKYYDFRIYNSFCRNPATMREYVNLYNDNDVYLVENHDTSASCYVQTAYCDCGSPGVEKYAHKLRFHGEKITKIEIFGRSGFYDYSPTTVLTHEPGGVIGDKEIRIPGTSPWVEIAVKFTGTGIALRHIEIEYSERRTVK